LSSLQRFSPCSLRSIRKVLQAKSGRCFSEPEESFCGNLRVEGDEECDAGLLGTEDNDPCCDKNCRLRRAAGVNCSDKNSPCCQDCQFMASGLSRLLCVTFPTDSLEMFRLQARGVARLSTRPANRTRAAPG